MKRFANLPFKQKLLWLTLTCSAAALMLGALGFIAADLLELRRAMPRNLQIIAQIIADNAQAPLAFNDAKFARETLLRSLSAHPHITHAILYDAEGKVFAEYERVKEAYHPPPKVQAAGCVFTDGHLHLFQPVRYSRDGQDLAGTVYLQSDLDEFYDQLWAKVSVTLGVLVIALGGSFLVGLWLLRFLARPLEALAKTAQSVVAQSDYSLRAHKFANDELGTLTEGFNQMLAQIQARDGALQAAHDSLEQRVAERTSELTHSLSVLQATLESTADGIMVVNQSGRVEQFNQKFAEMWRLPTGLVAACDDHRLIAFVLEQLQDPGSFVAKVEALHAQPEATSFDVLEFKDGRTFERYSQPQQVGGLGVGRVWSFRDITERQRAEAALRESMRLSQLGLAVSQGLALQATLPAALQECCAALVRHLDAAFARIWTLQEGATMLELRASAGLYTHLDGPHRQVPVGQFKIGLIAAEKQPHLTNSVIGDPRVNNQDWAKQEGMVAFAGYPLLVENRVVGVVALFARHPLSELTFTALGSITNEIALGIARKQLEAELERSHEQYRRAITAANAIPYQKDYASDTYVFMGEGIQGLTGYAPAELRAAVWKEIILETVFRGEASGLAVAEAKGRNLAGELKGWQADYRIRTRSGEVRWLSDASVSILTADGKYAGSVGIIQDITERKQAEATMQMREQRAQQQRLAIATLAVDEAVVAGDVRTALRRLTEVAAAALQIERVSLWLLSADQATLRCVALFETKARQHSEGATLTSADYPRYFEAIRTEHQICAANARTDPRTSEFAAGYLVPLNITAMLDAGIRRAGELAGVVCFEHVGEPRAWHADEAAFAATLADLVAQTLATAERQQLEAAVAQERQLLRTLVDQLPDRIYFKDAAGHYLLNNRAHLQSLGVAAQADTLGKTTFDFHPPDLAQEYHTGEQEVIHSGTAMLDREERARHRGTGELRWHLTSKVPLRDAQGQVSGLIGISHDITVHKQAEAALHASETKFRTLVEHLPQKVFVKDRNLRFVSVNENFARALGLPPEEVVGKGDADFAPPELAAKYRADDERIMRTGQTEELEEKHIQDGRETWVQVVKTPVRDERGEITGVFGIFWDITRRKQAEEALRQAKAQMQEALAMSFVATARAQELAGQAESAI